MNSDEHRYGTKTQQKGYDKDEADATARQAADREKERAQKAANDAAEFAAAEVTAAKAKVTFWDRFKQSIGWDETQTKE